MTAEHGRQSTGDLLDASAEPGWGDQMLSYLLLAHDLMTTVGARRAAEWFTARDLAHAIAACRYFELDELGALLVDLPAAAVGDGPARHLDERYRQLVPDEDRLVEAAERKRLLTPADFEA
jgi:hypothetical protein